jgi:hypothetical protein
MSKYTKEQIEAMTPEQLKRAVATDVMGLSIYHYDKDYEANCYYMLVDGLDPVARFDGLTTGERKTEEEAWADCPDYLTDHSALWEMEEFVYAMSTTMGLKYALQLLELLDINTNRTLVNMAKLIRATPEQRCKAALLAVME